MISQTCFIIHPNAHRPVFEGAFQIIRMYGHLIQVRKFVLIALTMRIDVLISIL
jgi:hypothetical protein